MEKQHEEEHHQWVVEEEEEVEDAALEGRQSRKHLEGNVIASVIVSSSSSSSSSSPTGAGLTNGVSSVATQPDGPLIQNEEEVAEMGDIAENGNHCNGDKVDNAAVGLGLVAEFVGAATNGEAITSNAINAASQNKNSVYFDKQEGSEANNGPYGAQNVDGSRSVLPTNDGMGEFDIQVENLDIQNSLCNEVNNQDMKTVEDKGPSCSVLSPLHNSSEVKATDVYHFNNETSTKAGPDLIEEIDQRLRELDVEAVLAKQETHDLFCPNCNSCITKRVILKKRKRNIHNLDTKAKRDKLELDYIISSKIVDSPADETNQGDNEISTSGAGSIEPPADNDPVREPEVFRCLQCFSFFIPRGDCFKLFWNFGGAHKPETSRNPSSIPASNIQNSSSISASNKQNPSSISASNMQNPSSISASNIQNPSSISASNMQTPSSITVSNVQNPSNVPASNANWFFSLFTSNKGKAASEQGNASHKLSKTSAAEQNHPSSVASNILISPEVGHPESPSTNTKNGKSMPDIKPGHEGLTSPITSTVEPVKIESGIKKDFKFNTALGNAPLTVGNVMHGLQKVGRDIIEFSANEHTLTRNVRTNVGEEKKDSADIKKTDIVANLPSMRFAGDKVPKHEATVNAGEPAKDAILEPYEVEPYFLVPSNIGSKTLEKSQKDIDKTPDDTATNIQGSGVDAEISSEQDFKLIKKVEKDIEKEIKAAVRKDKTGSDVIVFIEADTVKSSTFQTADTIPVEGAILPETAADVYSGEQPRDEIGEPYGWEVLKSIVYGGLLESITSLGIVSSAAGAGAAPLNIIALGLANLIGGLFIIGHNLFELKNDHSGEDLQQTNMQEDRYQELLGRRANFILHAVVTALSFLIFGSAPLVIYGILIRKSYYAEVKLAAVAATSLVCIILLAIGKVYTKRPPKSYIRTILYYATTALAASGVSYIVGGLIKDLLEKFSQSESGFVITMPVSGTGRMEPAWTSY